ncbi:hypothetical protein WDV93_12425 [Pantoea ananatis]
MNKTILALAAVASASAIVPLMAQASYAYVGTYNPNGEGVYRFIDQSRRVNCREKHW